ncbi:MmgE/PrpD family protein [Pseudoroseicyclus sp. CXY001]|uniref:MmgE/PrpD family protein n=1 Tax=Pseudoroseicyclus sp. CXY001 TaxID=3242492 RepID=UPI00358DB81F
MTQAVSAALAEFTATATVPPEARAEAARSILNGLATGLAGAPDAAVTIARGTLARLEPGGGVGLIGARGEAGPLTAAFLNAMAINVHDFDDTHPVTILHPTAPVLPVLLSLAAMRPVTGRAFLDAFAIGVEVECRIANAVTPEHYRRGWHITASCGVFGAAAAAARILGLPAERVLHAFGAASAQASGLVETLGYMAKSVGVGGAARGGLLAAFMAEDGLQGPDAPIEGPRGFMRATTDEIDPALALPLADGGWEILRNTYKPYPCGVVLNPVIEAALELGGGRPHGANDIASVTVAGPSLLSERADRPAPLSGRTAQVSAQHAVAAALARVSAGLADFSDAAVADPALTALRGKVRVEVDSSMPLGSARVEVTFADGRAQTRTITRAEGDTGRPLSTDRLRAKLATLAGPGVDADALADLVLRLDEVEDAGRILEAVRLRD